MSIKLPWPKSKYDFIRMELRTIQNMCKDDNESFLNIFADKIGDLDALVDSLTEEVHALNYPHQEVDNE